MKKRTYTQPIMEVCKLELNQPILAGSTPKVTEIEEENENTGGW